MLDAMADSVSDVIVAFVLVVVVAVVVAVVVCQAIVSEIRERRNANYAHTMRIDDETDIAQFVFYTFWSAANEV